MGKRFRCTVDSLSSETLASRNDNKRIVTHIRGWDIGVEVQAYIDMEGNDAFDVWTTGGSNDDGRKVFVATVKDGHA